MKKKLLVLILAYVGLVFVFTLFNYYSDQQERVVRALIFGLISGLTIFIIPIWKKFSNPKENINSK